jgi:hypothetical protein
MKTELQNKLYNKYSEFFEYLKVQDGPIMPMSFGVECGDGWYVILDTLMGNIQSYINLNKKGMIFYVTQIKEKYGNLRFYYNGGDEYIDGMVSMAEAMSSETCEFCGTTSNVGYTTGWICTICKDCFDSGVVYMTEWKQK